MRVGWALTPPKFYLGGHEHSVGQPKNVYAEATHLRSANTQQLASPRTNTCYGDRSFAVSGPSVWNNLPTALRMSDCSLMTFRVELKTLLFI